MCVYNLHALINSLISELLVYFSLPGYLVDGKVKLYSFLPFSASLTVILGASVTSPKHQRLNTCTNLLVGSYISSCTCCHSMYQVISCLIDQLLDAMRGDFDLLIFNPMINHRCKCACVIIAGEQLIHHATYSEVAKYAASY